jgi:cytochrome c2
LLRSAAAAALGTGFAWPAHGADGANRLEGDPFRGRTLFVQKLCNQCHSVWGHGGTLGPDISQIVAGKRQSQLAGEFWNHTPRMIEEMVNKGHAWPTLDRGEMADLLSYLYYLRLFDEPGNAARGAATFARLRCESCHSLGGAGGTTGGPLDRFSGYTSPLPIAQAMWNAGPAMRQAQVGSGTAIPSFSGREMSDIQAHIRDQGWRSADERVRLLPQPSPAAGESVFVAKRCSACHGSGRAGAPNLSEDALRVTGAEISGILWNHSYAMQDRMNSAGIPFPRFRDHELADLISYLHFLSYKAGTGNPDRGMRLFREKGCAACHEEQRMEAPDILAAEVTVDAISLSAAMWNHAPQMYRVMAEHDVPWPRFEKNDVEDLVAYFRRLVQAGKATTR